MGEAIFGNVWATLTVAIPGLVTYGTWRLLFLFGNDWRIDMERLAQADDSVVLSMALVAAIAIAQQAVAITIEALLGCLSDLTGSRGGAWRKLLLRRFKTLAKGDFTEDARRTVAQFFLSLNVLIGQAGVLLYFLLVENAGATSAIPVALYGVIGFLLVSCSFRAWAAKEVMP